ncbi:MAG: hypothetical protein M3P95_02765 [Actinomycetota bacterium]|nr:hypothetical protein [Actinomycetota bacterium]
MQLGEYADVRGLEVVQGRREDEGLVDSVAEAEATREDVPECLDLVRDRRPLRRFEDPCEQLKAGSVAGRELLEALESGVRGGDRAGGPRCACGWRVRP